MCIADAMHMTVGAVRRSTECASSLGFPQAPPTRRLIASAMRRRPPPRSGGRCCLGTSSIREAIGRDAGATQDSRLRPSSFGHRRCSQWVIKSSTLSTCLRRVPESGCPPSPAGGPIPSRQGNWHMASSSGAACSSTSTSARLRARFACRVSTIRGWFAGTPRRSSGWIGLRSGCPLRSRVRGRCGWTSWCGSSGRRGLAGRGRSCRTQSNRSRGGCRRMSTARTASGSSFLSTPSRQVRCSLSPSGREPVDSARSSR